jgi:hypothetical protein
VLGSPARILSTEVASALGPIGHSFTIDNPRGDMPRPVGPFRIGCADFAAADGHPARGAVIRYPHPREAGGSTRHAGTMEQRL